MAAAGGRNLLRVVTIRPGEPMADAFRSSEAQRVPGSNYAQRQKNLYNSDNQPQSGIPNCFQTWGSTGCWSDDILIERNHLSAGRSRQPGGRGKPRVIEGYDGRFGTGNFAEQTN